jgi:hypothetical protein
MARIILKCPYLKGGEKTAAHLSNLVKYIATRDGVEKMESGHKLWHSTKKQKDLIAQILREFPDAKELFEYEDYLENSNRGNASEFITIALERHLDKISGREKYLDYIANRPRVEKFDSHGLFTAGDDPLVLSQVADEVANHTGNVWTPIISLRREDAAQMGYDNVLAWKALLSEKAVEIAENMKIHPDHLKWYAAFHNESHHPHIHMVCYSTDPREGYLTKQGIKKMKSSLANEIFRQELIPLYGGGTDFAGCRKRSCLSSDAEFCYILSKKFLSTLNALTGITPNSFSINREINSSPSIKSICGFFAGSDASSIAAFVNELVVIKIPFSIFEFSDPLKSLIWLFDMASL